MGRSQTPCGGNKRCGPGLSRPATRRARTEPAHADAIAANSAVVLVLLCRIVGADTESELGPAASDVTGSPMQRITITVDDDLMDDLDRVIEARGYQNRSEAIRDLARAGIQQAAQETGASRDCVAALVYVYDHKARDLSKRLVRSFHEHHEMALSTLHLHLDHDSCMEVTVLKGRTG